MCEGSTKLCCTKGHDYATYCSILLCLVNILIIEVFKPIVLLTFDMLMEGMMANDLRDGFYCVV